MKTLAVLLAVAAASFITPFASNPVSAASVSDSVSAAMVIETNSGTIVYYAQVQSTATDISARILTFAQSNLNDLTESQYDISADDGLVSLAIKFDDYQSFAEYNQIDPDPNAVRDIDIKKSLFFVERTITMKNPYNRFFDITNTKTAKTMDQFNKTFNISANQEVEYVYVFASTFRRTTVNSDKSQHALDSGYWEYYFNVSADNTADLQNEIIIFDRFANTPAWYGVAIAATLAFMIGFYLIQKKKKEKKSPQIQ